MAKDGTNPRQSDIARAAQVSQATVSLILTGRADAESIPRATQDRVRAAMVELGYVPNVAAQSLRGGRNGLIGVHTFESVFPVTSEDYYNEFLVGIEEQAVEMGVDLVLFASTQRADGRRRIYGNGSNRLRLADGAVLLGVERDDEELERLAQERFPFVFIGRRDGVSSRMPYVSPDYVGALSDVLTQLADLGHAAISYFGRPERTSPDDDRLAGFVRHAARLNVSVVSTDFISPLNMSSQWLSTVLDSGCTAILVESHDMAAAAMDAARAVGIAIPADLSMVCLDVGAKSPAAETWSHIQVPRRRLGRRAVSLLMDLLDGRIQPEYHETLAITPASYATIARPRTTLRLTS